MTDLEFAIVHLEDDLLNNKIASNCVKAQYKELRSIERKRYYYTQIMENLPMSDYYRTHSREDAIKDLNHLKETLKSIKKDNKSIKKEIKSLRKHL
ncbi:MAG: hypothetical protein ACI4OT_01450 [Bacilli bacterium]